MDGENNGKPYEQMDDLEENPLFSETSISAREEMAFKKRTHWFWGKVSSGIVSADFFLRF